MTQNEHYIVAAVQWIITWYGFWAPLFNKLTTKEERVCWDKKVDEFLDKL